MENNGLKFFLKLTYNNRLENISSSIGIKTQVANKYNNSFIGDFNKTLEKYFFCDNLYIITSL